MGRFAMVAPSEQPVAYQGGIGDDQRLAPPQFAQLVDRHPARLFGIGDGAAHH